MPISLHAALLLSLATTAGQPPSPASRPAITYPRAQHLVDDLVAKHVGMIDAILHVSPTPEAPNIVVAAHLQQANGEASGADDLGVAATGAPLVEVQKDGHRLGVLVQLRDARRRPIGALGLMYAYNPGDDVEGAVRRSFRIRDAVERSIPSTAALVR